MDFKEEKLAKNLESIKKVIHRKVIDIPCFKYIEKDIPGAEKVYFDDSSWQNFQVGNYWGGYDITAWFRTKIKVPESWRKGKVALHFLVGPRDGAGSTAESLLYVNGIPLQGIDVWHKEAILPPDLLKSEELQIALKAWSSVVRVPDRRQFKLARLVLIDEDAEKYYHLASNILASLKILTNSDLRKHKLLTLLNESYKTINLNRPGSDEFYHTVKKARDYLTKKLSSLSEGEELKPTITGVGHSHLDMAWMV